MSVENYQYTKKVQRLIGDICRTSRIEDMRLTLEEMSEQVNVPLKTLSNFENGRSSNINIFYRYVLMIDNKERLELINKVLEGVENAKKSNR